MVLISQNNVLLIKKLVSVALKHVRSINYIVEKVIDAIDGVYRARPSEEDKDLAFLLITLGGPSLLDILYKANKLPSCSTAYRLAKDFKSLACPVSLTEAECLENNLVPSSLLTSWIAFIKFDETFLTPRLSQK